MEAYRIKAASSSGTTTERKGQTIGGDATSDAGAATMAEGKSSDDTIVKAVSIPPVLAERDEHTGSSRAEGGDASSGTPRNEAKELLRYDWDVSRLSGSEVAALLRRMRKALR